MQRLALLLIVAALSLLTSCFVITGEMRRATFNRLVGKPSSEMMAKYGPPDEAQVVGDTGYATYYLPIGDGTNRKVLFVIGPDDIVKSVNYWPK